ncbi:AraC family transcriptional regulator [Alistipes timonensis]|uniref:AraC family transcriptional regulator n=1 Tax=Alistipes timonensis TaxID=1465754 RepID=UPI001C3C97CA|nr:helix-turn-helix domain-containing protein [Alistipes timonensis]MCR2030321.1 AraC family transcriptional regulator [Alistipes timonensis]
MNSKATEAPITSFTLSELIAMSGGEKRPGLLGECIAANSSSQMEVFRFPGRLDAFVIGVCTEGETTFTSNLKEYRLKKDSLFIIGPKHILQIQSDNRFKAHVIVITPDFLRRINIDTKHMMPLFLQFGSRPCMELTHKECTSLRSFISMVEQELEGPETDFAVEIVGGLIAATIYKVGDILTHYIEEHPELENPIHNRAEEYFKQFTELLGEHYTRERSVGYYARQLCITPKYLTTLIKRISGKSVSEWIDSYVILEAKTLLKYSNMSVQEIAYYLNFPNQSFFGSYFKRNTGMSPSQYKAKQ